MSTDSEIRDRLHSAVSDTATPPAFAVTVLRGGRSRRRRRYAAVGIAAAVAISTGAFLHQPDPPVAHDGDVAEGEREDVGLTWARSLPAGPAAKLPYFAGETVRDGDAVVPIPDDVNRWLVPRRVDGGWVVVLGTHNGSISPAVLSADGGLRQLPTYELPAQSGTTIVASADGSQVAYGDLLVDVATGQATTIPEGVSPRGWTDDGLVFTTDPVSWSPRLLRLDGTSVGLETPEGSVLDDSGPTDVALRFDQASESDTCTSTWHLVDEAWAEQPRRCLGRSFKGSSDISPDGRWLLSDDLPEVWDLQSGQFTELNVPGDVAAAGHWVGMGGWESDDTFVVPFFDEWVHEELLPEGGLEQRMQIVRCTISTGECEKAGEELVSVSQEDATKLFSPVVRFGSAGR